MSEDIQFIVQSLNKPPFNMRLSLVTLDSKSGIELLEVVNTVFAYLDKSYERQTIQEDEKAAVAASMLEFVVILKYKTAEEIESFSPRFLAADKTVIYPFLAWMLARLPELQKRAYIARFLRPPSIPDDLFADEQIVSLIQQLRSAQEVFTQTHKEVEAARETHISPTELETDISQLESELEQLDSKLHRIRTRIQTSPEFQTVDFEEVLSATHNLRQEQEEEANLARQLHEQNVKVELAIQTRRQLNNTLSQLQDQLRQVSPTQLLQSKREEVVRLRATNEQLEKTVRERTKTYREYSKAITTTPLSLDLVDQLQYDCEVLNQQIRMLLAERDRMHPETGANSAAQIQFCRKRLHGLEERLERQTERLKELEEEKKGLEEDLQRLDGEIHAIVGDGTVLTDSQLVAYASSMKEKMEKVRVLKLQLQASQKEVDILTNTQKILESRDERLSEIVHELEKKKGIVGYSEMVSQLEDIGIKSSDVNADKGATLDQITKMIELINTTIKSKRTQLQPLISELKTVRQEYDLIELDYTRKHKSYESIAGSLRVEREKIIQEITKLQTEIRNDETTLHQLKSLDTVLQARLEQGHKEDMYVLARGRLNREYRTFQDRLEKVLDNETRKTKLLQEEQKTLMQSHQNQVGQRKMFMQLKALLTAKNKSVQSMLESKQQDNIEKVAYGIQSTTKSATETLGNIIEDAEE